MMRSGRVGLSDYTTRRLAELQALRVSVDQDDPPPTDRSSRTQHPVSPPIDEGLGPSRGGSSGGDGVTSPGSLGSPPDPPPAAVKIALPSALLESKRAALLTSKVGYTSLALPPDGAYRPLRGTLHGGVESNVLYVRHQTGSSEFVEGEIEPLPLLPPPPPSSSSSSSSSSAVTTTTTMTTTKDRQYGETKWSAGLIGMGMVEEEKRKKAMTIGNNATNGSMDDGKKSLAIKADDGCIGFAKLPDQVHRKAIKRGFDFTLMVVGESGLGKSTLISSMFFQNDFYHDRTIPEAGKKLSRTVEIEKRLMEIEELGVRLRLTVVDTPGFNDALNSTDCWKPVNKYILDQFEDYLKDESGLNRQTIQDHRVHCCLYFISPYGRGLRQVDVDFMKRLQHRVNIVPIIAKADVLTPSELKQLKSKVMEEIRGHRIQIYELPPTDNDEDEDFKRKDRELKAAYPFAVIGGNTMIEVDGKRVKGRVYPWGIVEAENPEFSNVTLLRQFLVSTHLHDLKEVTKDVHYENFRAGVIDQKSKTLPPISSKIDADKLLKEKEEEIKRMHMMLQKMQSQMYNSR